MEIREGSHEEGLRMDGGVKEVKRVMRGGKGSLGEEVVGGRVRGGGYTEGSNV